MRVSLAKIEWCVRVYGKNVHQSWPLALNTWYSTFGVHVDRGLRRHVATFGVAGLVCTLLMNVCVCTSRDCIGVLQRDLSPMYGDVLLASQRGGPRFVVIHQI